MSHTRDRTSRRAAGHREDRRTPREAPDGARDRGGSVGAGEPRLRRAGLFDIRTFIAMLLGIYGVVLVLMGFFGLSRGVRGMAALAARPRPRGTGRRGRVIGPRERLVRLA